VSDPESCSVCGRTILAGEGTRAYITPEGARRTVCDLCRERAERVGWVWEEIAPEMPADGGRRRAGLGSLLRGRALRRREAPPEDSDFTEPQQPALDPEPEPAAQAEPEPEPEPAPPPPRRSPDPAAPGAGIGRSPSRAESRMSRIESAIERFNHSEQSVMIAGLARTLGTPWVSVGAAAGSPSEVRITVAWELSWYQWGVDTSDELRAAYEIGKGGELGELDAPARQWNARMEDSGRIEIGVVPIGRSAGGAASA
jgi:hypothetical protein